MCYQHWLTRRTRPKVREHVTLALKEKTMSLICFPPILTKDEGTPLTVCGSGSPRRQFIYSLVLYWINPVDSANSLDCSISDLKNIRSHCHKPVQRVLFSLLGPGPSNHLGSEELWWNWAHYPVRWVRAMCSYTCPDQSVSGWHCKVICLLSVLC